MVSHSSGPKTVRTGRHGTLETIVPSMAVQFKQSGTVLFAGSGSVAMDPSCCCGGVPCSFCPGITPASITVEFDGDTGAFGTCCSEVEATYLLTQSEADPCNYIASVQGPYFGQNTTSGAMCNTTQPDACYSQVTDTGFDIVYEFRFVEDIEVGVLKTATGFIAVVSMRFRRVSIIVPKFGGSTTCQTSVSGTESWQVNNTDGCPGVGSIGGDSSLVISDGNTLIGACTNARTNGPQLTVQFV